MTQPDSKNQQQRDGSSFGQRNKKRPFDHRANKNHHALLSLRGQPGILLTCETGKERRCRREGLDILDYYWNLQLNNHQKVKCIAAAVEEALISESSKSTTRPVITTTKDSTSETNVNNNNNNDLLEEELASLRAANSSSNNSTSSAPFVEYETGCKGIVFLLCTWGLKRNDSRTPTPKMLDTTTDGSTATSMLVGKKQKTEVSNQEIAAKDEHVVSNKSDATCPIDVLSDVIVWDPLDLVEAIVADMQQYNHKAPLLSADDKEKRSSMVDIPSSRFVSRMIPMQATCGISLEEINKGLCRLLDSFFRNNNPLKLNVVQSSSRITFAIQLKRRFCQTNRDEIIAGAATTVQEQSKLAGNEWMVKLDEPDYTVWVEICKNICGISIIPTTTRNRIPNFNVAEIREQFYRTHQQADLTGVQA